MKNSWVSVKSLWIVFTLAELRLWELLRSDYSKILFTFHYIHKHCNYVSRCVSTCELLLAQLLWVMLVQYAGTGS